MLQSCPTLCDPVDGSPPGSPVPGTLQARTLEWKSVYEGVKSFPWFTLLWFSFCMLGGQLWYLEFCRLSAYCTIQLVWFLSYQSLLFLFKPLFILCLTFLALAQIFSPFFFFIHFLRIYSFSHIFIPILKDCVEIPVSGLNLI